MNNKKRIVLSILIMTLMSLLLACGSAQKESELIGEWELIEDVLAFGFFTYPKGSKVQFYSDGNMSFMGIGSKYEIVDGKLKLTENDGPVTYNEYKVDGDTLTLHLQATGLLAGNSVELNYKRVAK
ncbi:hypothetical protein EDC18_101361 [Natranaerovirga pectinivora]|uniref:Lipocalin-like protein n=1 Tax=Natranaerovirga pectinivora TaxID=682400 RepID=A0A4R3MP53_9FIRM|nr:hypothetical protein [Natranaerovirga pectinivora]TCT17065.1 hypothetical protein EDC18_101361 [Natranaerovirga pectinivora]